MENFRVSVCLSEFYSDHRSLSKIYINHYIKKIRDLQNHISQVFGIDEDFVLLCNNHYLPAVEDVRVLEDNDMVYVVPQTRSQMMLQNDDIPKTGKKRKRVDSQVYENYDHVFSSTHNEEIIENNVHNDLTEDAALPTKIETKPKKKKPKVDENGLEKQHTEAKENDTRKIKKHRTKGNSLEREEEVEIDTVVTHKKTKKKKNIEKTEESVPIDNDEVEDPAVTVKVLKIKSKNKPNKNVGENDAGSVNAKNNGHIEVTINGKHKTSSSSSDEETKKSHTDSKKFYFDNNSTFPVVNSARKPFVVSDVLNNLEHSFVTRRKRTRIRRRKPKQDVQETLPQIPVYEPPNTEAPSTNHVFFERETRTLEENEEPNEPEKAVYVRSGDKELVVCMDKSVSTYPLINKTPNVNDVIIFKILKISEDYTPAISKNIVAKIVSFSDETDTVQLQILVGQEECALPNGKFSLNENEENEVLNLIELKWTDLITPRLVSPA